MTSSSRLQDVKDALKRPSPHAFRSLVQACSLCSLFLPSQLSHFLIHLLCFLFSCPSVVRWQRFQAWSKVTSLTFDVPWMTAELLRVFTRNLAGSLTFLALHDWRKWNLAKDENDWKLFIRKVFPKLTGLKLVVTTAFSDSFKHAFVDPMNESWPKALTSFELQGDAMAEKFPFRLSSLSTLTSFSTNLPVACHLGKAMNRIPRLTRVRLEGSISETALQASALFFLLSVVFFALCSVAATLFNSYCSFLVLSAIGEGPITSYFRMPSSQMGRISHCSH